MTQKILCDACGAVLDHTDPPHLKANVYRELRSVEGSTIDVCSYACLSAWAAEQEAETVEVDGG